MRWNWPAPRGAGLRGEASSLLRQEEPQCNRTSQEARDYLSQRPFREILLPPKSVRMRRTGRARKRRVSGTRYERRRETNTSAGHAGHVADGTRLGWPDSNRRPHAPKACALTNCATPRDNTQSENYKPPCRSASSNGTERKCLSSIVPRHHFYLHGIRSNPPRFVWQCPRTARSRRRRHC